ncbi:transcription initiation factor TFIID subunit 4-like [Microplitis mediator]|uniref:transcription initiation factor TFIID subunit 4-like n=1 Tax=Microplitis mediator TaxID=375433 RepID=UPI00255730AE|nr:transcription initiation factor TFIID subunit 4-like [Microplitis mediator]
MQATPATTAEPSAPSPQQGENAEMIEKCREFLLHLLELSKQDPDVVESDVRVLIQKLIDTKVESEEFCDKLESLLNATAQPCLMNFLQKSLPLLRQSLISKESVIDGINPPSDE